MTINVENDGTVVIKAPKWTRKSTIDRFYKANIRWIKSRRKTIRSSRDKITVLTADDIKILKEKAKSIMAEKTAYYSKIMGVKPDNIKITSARRTWGTCRMCDGVYTICYSYRNMFLSDRCQDYIVVHELAHIKYMDHSPQFYALVEKYLPDYKERAAEIRRFKDYYVYEK